MPEINFRLTIDKLPDAVYTYTAINFRKNFIIEVIFCQPICKNICLQKPSQLGKAGLYPAKRGRCYVIFAVTLRQIPRGRSYAFGRIYLIKKGCTKQVDIPKYKASCPVCGRNLFRGAPNSYIESYCPKCGSFLQIAFSSAGVSAATGDSVKRPQSKQLLSRPLKIE